MGIDLSLNDFSLPVYVEKDRDYYSNLKTYFDRYTEHIKKIFEKNDKLVNTIENNCNLILKSILQYYDANIIDAEQTIEKMLEGYLDSALIVAPINENYAFRGLAPEKIRPSFYKTLYQDYEQRMSAEMYFFRSRLSETKLEIEDMLHIPFDNRGIISTQRFSIPGTPCLYFSTTTLGTWLEMGMPDINIFHTSAYELPEDLKILNLCLQQSFLNGYSVLNNMDSNKDKVNVNNISHFLAIFPLVIASSYVVGENNRKFKSEYIVSQLIMQASRRLGIDGIAYLSTRVDDIYAYPHCVNLAILMPCNENADRKYWERASEIKLTSPFRLTDINKDITDCNTFINKFYAEHIQNNVQIANNIFNYRELNFSKFDEFLWDKQKFEFHP